MGFSGLKVPRLSFSFNLGKRKTQYQGKILGLEQETEIKIQPSIS